MSGLAMILRLLEHSDWANAEALRAAAALSDEQLDRPLEIGPGAGSLRSILTHTWAGEETWLRRWRGDVEARWPNEDEGLSVQLLSDRFQQTQRGREDFASTLNDGALTREQTYRDSRGGLFCATLGDMLVQGVVHSIHHRAQAANAVRRLGAAAPEMDFMMRVRRPA